MELIIFDCDGTLVDSEFLCCLAFQHLLAELGIKYEATELMLEYRGGKLAEIISSLESKFSIILPDSFVSEYRNKVSNLFDEHLKANDGVADLLESLTIPFCVASSAPRSKIEQALRVTGLYKYFRNDIFSSYEVGSWKPEPGIFLHAAQAFKVEPANCWVVEDSIVGLQAAHNAQMNSVYYAPDIIEPNKFGSIQIQHMSELMEKINMQKKSV